jgi:hypothetical protein
VLPRRRALTKKFPDLELIDEDGEPREFDKDVDFKKMLTVEIDAPTEDANIAQAEDEVSYEKFAEWWAQRTGDDEPEISVLPAALVERIDEICGYEVLEKRDGASLWNFLRPRLMTLIMLRSSWGRVGDLLEGNTSKSSIFEQKALPATVRHPDSSFSSRWDVAQIFFLGYVSVMVPLGACFDLTAEPATFSFWLEVVVDVYFITGPRLPLLPLASRQARPLFTGCCDELLLQTLYSASGRLFGRAMASLSSICPRSRSDTSRDGPSSILYRVCRWVTSKSFSKTQMMTGAQETEKRVGATLKLSRRCGCSVSENCCELLASKNCCRSMKTNSMRTNIWGLCSHSCQFSSWGISSDVSSS